MAWRGALFLLFEKNHKQRNQTDHTKDGHELQIQEKDEIFKN